jgi:hypothetical protein
MDSWPTPVQNSDDTFPNLQRKEGISILNFINTSSLEVAKIIHNLAKLGDGRGYFTFQTF